MSKDHDIEVPDLLEDHFKRTGKRLRMCTEEGFAAFCSENCRELTPAEVAASDKRVADHQAFMAKATGKPEFAKFMGKAVEYRSFTALMGKVIRKSRKPKIEPAKGPRVRR